MSNRNREAENNDTNRNKEIRHTRKHKGGSTHRQNTERNTPSTANEGQRKPAALTAEFA